MPRASDLVQGLLSNVRPEAASFAPWRRSGRLSVLGAVRLRLWVPVGCGLA